MFLALYRTLIRLLCTLSKHTHGPPHTQRKLWVVGFLVQSQPKLRFSGSNLVAGCVFAFCSACFHASGVDVLFAWPGLSGFCPLFSEERATVIIRAFFCLLSLRAIFVFYDAFPNPIPSCRVRSSLWCKSGPRRTGLMQEGGIIFIIVNRPLVGWIMGWRWLQIAPLKNLHWVEVDIHHSSVL